MSGLRVKVNKKSGKRFEVVSHLGIEVRYREHRQRAGREVCTIVE